MMLQKFKYVEILSSQYLGKILYWAEDAGNPTCVCIQVDEGVSVDTILPLPADPECRLIIFYVDRFRISVASHSRRQLFGAINHPGIACCGREQDDLPDADDTRVVVSRLTLNVADFVG